MAKPDEETDMMVWLGIVKSLRAIKQVYLGSWETQTQGGERKPLYCRKKCNTFTWEVTPEVKTKPKTTIIKTQWIWEKEYYRDRLLMQLK